MKKTLTSLTFIAVIAFASMAMATTWTAIDNADFSFGGGNTYNKALVLDGFAPGTDTITSGLLALNFDNSGLTTKIVFDAAINTIPHPVFLGFDGDLTYQVAGSDLADGKLDLMVSGLGSRIFEGLTLDTAPLRAYEYESPASAPDPAPGAMMLLGAGFLGLAVYGKRRKNL